MKRLLLVCVVAFVAAYSAPTKLFAQGATESGTISGTVTDPTGAVVPNAKVTVVNPATSAQRVTSTDTRGAYVVPGLLPAVYSVTVEASGFAKAEKRAQVTVGTPVTVDFQLALGAAVSTTVEVTGAAGVAVNTENQTLSTVLDTARILELPTITRNIYSLVATSGMVSEDDPAGGIINGQIVGRGAGPAINGLRAASTNVLLDGAANNDEFTASVGQSVPLDAVQEYSIITNQFSAQYGRAAAGVVNVATKSGTNSFHGTAYEFNRVAALSSNTFDNNARGRDRVTGQPIAPKSIFTRNQFGYSVGGPIKKGKLFFFSSTEWTRIRSSAAQDFLIPDPALIAASNVNTRNFFNAFPRRTDLRTVAALTRDGVRALGQDPCSVGGGAVAPACSAAFPLGSTTPMFDRVTYNTPSDAGGGTPENGYSMVHRVDWNISPNTQFYARFAFNNEIQPAGTVSTSPYQGFETGTNLRDQSAVVSFSHSISPRLLTSTKFAFNRLKTVQPLGAQPSIATLFWLNVPPTLASISTPLPGYLSLTPGNGIPFGGPQNLFQTYEDVTYTKGAHTLQFGGSYVFIQDNRTFGAYQYASEILSTSTFGSGVDRFLGGQLRRFQVVVDPQGHLPCRFPAPRTTLPPPAPPGTPNPQAGQCVNPASGAVGSQVVDPFGNITLPVSAPSFSRSNRYNEMAAYFQDSWKMRPRLTINLGLRWDYYGVQHNKNPRLDSNYYDLAGGDIFDRIRNGQVSIAGQSQVGGLWAKDRKDFGPRIGFAWDVFGNGKTSLRGGYGISYERNFGNVTFNIIQNPPAQANVRITAGVDVPTGSLPITTNRFGPLAGTSGTARLPVVSLRNVNPDIKNAYAHLWSVSLERQVASGVLAGIDYSGSKGKRLYSIEDINRPGAGNVFLGDPCTFGTFSGSNPCTNRLTVNSARPSGQYSAINRRGNGGSSIYNALNFRLDLQNPRFFGWESGLTVRANYTYSKAIDNLSSTFSESLNDFNLGFLDPFNPDLDRGPADFDNHHRIALSAVWAVPFARHTTGLWKRVFDGWEVAPIFTARTGAPFSVFDSSNTVFEVTPRAFNLAGTPGLPRTGPNNSAVAGSPNLFNYISITNSAGSPLFDSSYVNPISGTSEFGPYPANMTGRNTFRAPGAWNLDVGVYKTTAVTERVKIQLRAEMFNALNHSNLYVDTSGVDVSSGANVFAKRGVTTQALVFTNPGFDERRNVQLALKVIF
jgi:outer membrane receptor protein involved in Fe transport